MVREVNPATGVITTVAGTGTDGYSGDNGLATAAELDVPHGVAVDASGDLFIADTYSNRIREVDLSTGVITTLAGNGFPGYSGDNGQATAAELDAPRGVAVDSSGHLFIADTGNNAIREVNLSTGVITTVAGNGTAGYSGDGGPATAAQLATPCGVAVDSSGHLFIADTNNSAIREVNLSTELITTVAGDGTAGYSGDNGQATAAEMNYPSGVAVDTSGHLFIADSGNSAIREVNLPTGVITTVVGQRNRRLQRRQPPGHRGRARCPRWPRGGRRRQLLLRRLQQSADPAITPGVLAAVSQAVPTLTVTHAGGTYNGSGLAATATVAGVVSGVDTTPEPSLEGVSPTFTYYVGSTPVGSGSPTVPSAAGDYTVVASFAGSADYTAAQSSTVPLVIAKAPLTVSGVTANNKVYDGTTAATLNTAGAAPQGVFSGDTVTLAAAGATGTFSGKNVANGLMVSVSGLTIGGPQAGDYWLAQPTTTANITALPVTVTAAASTKVYDGTTSATALPTITAGSLVTGDIAAFTETYSTKNVGTGKTLTVAGSVNDGNGGNNYAVTFVACTNGVITSLVSYFTVTTSPTTVTAGNNFIVVVAADDANGNIVTSFDGIVQLSCDDGNGRPSTSP